MFLCCAAPDDFAGIDSVLVFPMDLAFTRAECVNISIEGDELVEEEEGFSVAIINTTNPESVLVPTHAVNISILDNSSEWSYIAAGMDEHHYNFLLVPYIMFAELSPILVHSL